MITWYWWLLGWQLPHNMFCVTFLKTTFMGYFPTLCVFLEQKWSYSSNETDCCQNYRLQLLEWCHSLWCHHHISVCITTLTLKRRNMTSCFITEFHVIFIKFVFVFVRIHLEYSHIVRINQGAFKSSAWQDKEFYPRSFGRITLTWGAVSPLARALNLPLKQERHPTGHKSRGSDQFCIRERNTKIWLMLPVCVFVCV